jgi:hypothetical protein
MHGIVVAGALVMVMSRTLGDHTDPASVTMGCVGAFAVLLAATINHRTVTTTTRVFKTQIPMRPA